MRVRLEPGDGGPAVARIAGEQGAGVLSSFAAADALMVVPEAIERAYGQEIRQVCRRSCSDRRPGSGRVVATARLFPVTVYPSHEETLDTDIGGITVQKFGALDSMRTMMSVLREPGRDSAGKWKRRPASSLWHPPRMRTPQFGVDWCRGPIHDHFYRGVDEPIGSVAQTDAAVDPKRTGAGSRVAEALRFEFPRFEGSDPKIQLRSTGCGPIS